MIYLDIVCISQFTYSHQICFLGIPIVLGILMVYTILQRLLIEAQMVLRAAFANIYKRTRFAAPLSI